MIQKWLIGLGISFILRQLAKWQSGINWDLVKADLDKRIRDLIPGELFDDEAVAGMHALVDMVAAVLAAQSDIEKIISLAVDGKFAEAIEALKKLILDQFKPETEQEKAIVTMVASL